MVTNVLHLLTGSEMHKKARTGGTCGQTLVGLNGAFQAPKIAEELFMLLQIEPFLNGLQIYESFPLLFKSPL